MKNDGIIDEIKTVMKRLEKKNNTKTVLFVALGIIVGVLGIIFLVLKLRDKFMWGNYDDYCDDDFDEFDYEDYADDYDDEDIEDDFSALDFEEE